jgi:flavin reductase (DIM6/NTAB) family NADH-FMN oxidoreductase RutF
MLTPQHYFAIELFMDAMSFKAAMRHVAASVCLITTTTRDGDRYGCTATAVCSLSADPASLLCCLNHASHSYAAITEARTFCVNVLSAEHDALADWFATNRPADVKFSMGDWRTGCTGVPVLGRAAVSFECTLGQIIDSGTHAILIGQVIDISIGGIEPRPLVYVRGEYGQFAPLAAAQRVERARAAECRCPAEGKNTL